MPLETRYVGTFIMERSDKPGLVQTDDGNVWLVRPDGSRVMLPGGGGGGSFPTFHQLDTPVDPADGDTWMKTNGNYPAAYGVPTYRWNGDRSLWEQFGTPVAVDADGNVLGQVTVGPDDGNIVIERFLDGFNKNILLWNDAFVQIISGSTNLLVGAPEGEANDPLTLRVLNNTAQPFRVDGDGATRVGAFSDSADASLVIHPTGEASDPLLFLVLDWDDDSNVFQIDQFGQTSIEPVGNHTALNLLPESPASDPPLVVWSWYTQAATVEIAQSDAAIVYTAIPLGADGNNFDVGYFNDGASQPLTVDGNFSGASVRVSLATDGDGNPTSTAAEVVAAVNGAGSPWFTAGLVPGSDPNSLALPIDFQASAGGVGPSQFNGFQVDAFGRLVVKPGTLPGDLDNGALRLQDPNVPNPESIGQLLVLANNDVGTVARWNSYGALSIFPTGTAGEQVPLTLTGDQGQVADLLDIYVASGDSPQLVVAVRSDGSIVVNDGSGAVGQISPAGFDFEGQDASFIAGSAEGGFATRPLTGQPAYRADGGSGALVALDAGGLLVKNVNDPVDPQDAVNLRTLQATGGGVVDLIFTEANVAVDGFPVTAVDQGGGSFTIDGDATPYVQAGSFMIVSGSSNNDGLYLITNVLLDSGSTTISVDLDFQVITDGTADGDVFVPSYRANPTLPANAIVKKLTVFGDAVPWAAGAALLCVYDADGYYLPGYSLSGDLVGVYDPKNLIPGGNYLPLSVDGQTTGGLSYAPALTDVFVDGSALDSKIWGAPGVRYPDGGTPILVDVIVVAPAGPNGITRVRLEYDTTNEVAGTPLFPE